MGMVQQNDIMIIIQNNLDCHMHFFEEAKGVKLVHLKSQLHTLCPQLYFTFNFLFITMFQNLPWPHMYPQCVCSQQASPINVSPHEQDEKNLCASLQSLCIKSTDHLS